MSKEDIYDEQISPLVKKILTVCKEHQIPMVMTFCIPRDDDDPNNPLQSTSAYVDASWGTPEKYVKALEIIRPSKTTVSYSTVAIMGGIDDILTASP
jgi:hypothetical protein